MKKQIGNLISYKHPMNGAQLDFVTSNGTAEQIHCGEKIELKLLGKFVMVRIELEYDLDRYYGITADGFHICNLNNKIARV